MPHYSELTNTAGGFLLPGGVLGISQGFLLSKCRPFALPAIALVDQYFATTFLSPSPPPPPSPLLALPSQPSLPAYQPTSNLLCATISLLPPQILLSFFFSPSLTRLVRHKTFGTSFIGDAPFRLTFVLDVAIPSVFLEVVSVRPDTCQRWPLGPLAIWHTSQRVRAACDTPPRLGRRPRLQSNAEYGVF